MIFIGDSSEINKLTTLVTEGNAATAALAASFAQFLLKFAAVETQISAVQAAALQIEKEQNTMALDFTALTADVTNNTSVEQSAVALFTNISAQLQAALASLAAGDDAGAQTTIAALDTTLAANNAALAAAIVANTPAAPAAPAAPPSSQKK